MEQSFPQCKTILWCLYVCKVNMHIVYNVTYPFGHLSTLCIKKWQLNCWIIELVTFFQFPLGCVTNETFLSCNINIQMILVVVSIKQTITTKLLLRNSPYVKFFYTGVISIHLYYVTFHIQFYFETVIFVSVYLVRVPTFSLLGSFCRCVVHVC